MIGLSSTWNYVICNLNPTLDGVLDRQSDIACRMHNTSNICYRWIDASKEPSRSPLMASLTNTVLETIDAKGPTAYIIQG